MASTNDWQTILDAEHVAPYWADLQDFVSSQRASHEIYPPVDEVYRALELTSLADTKVLILGQDPYHGPGQANGLAFSVRYGLKIPPSLQNIHKELEADLDMPRPQHGSLEPWATQGVLLLNTTLTVRAHEAASHQKQGWETFTDQIIRAVSAKHETVVFILWGASARKKKALIDTECHVVLESPHPSPLSARRGFFGSAPFSTANAVLVAAGRTPVNWML